MSTGAFFPGGLPPRAVFTAAPRCYGGPPLPLFVSPDADLYSGTPGFSATGSSLRTEPPLSTAVTQPAASSTSPTEPWLPSLPSDVSVTTANVTHTFLFTTTTTSTTVTPSSLSWADVAASTTAGTVPVSSSAVTENASSLPHSGLRAPHTFSFSRTSTATHPNDRGIAIRSTHRVSTVEEYLTAISSVLPARNITDAFRANGFIYVYFSDASWARQLIADGLNFRNTLLECLPLGVAPKKVLLSNVSPIIEDYMITSMLSHYGVVQGGVRKLPAAVTNPDFKHIKSARREVSVLFEDDAAFRALPDFLTVYVDHEMFALPVNAPVRCVACGETGHLNRNCPNVPLSSAPSAAPTDTASTTVPKKRRSKKMGPPGASSSESVIPPADSVVTSSSPTEAVIASNVSETLPKALDVSLSSPLPPNSRDSSVGRATATPLSSTPFSPSDTEYEDADMDFDSDPTVKVVTRRSRRSKSPPDSTSKRKLPMGPPTQRPKKRQVSSYRYDAATNSWTDPKGPFKPIFSHAETMRFISRTLGVPAQVARTICGEYASDAATVYTLSRQVLVIAHTDPAIAAIANVGQRRNERNKYYRVSSAIRAIFKDLSDVDSSQDH